MKNVKTVEYFGFAHCKVVLITYLLTKLKLP